MSRTGKSRPCWVQRRDPLFRWPLQATHRHYGIRYHDMAEEECDLDFPLPVARGGRTQICRWWPRRRDNDKLYGRSGWRRKHPGREGAARAALRQLARGWVKCLPEDRDNIVSSESCTSRHWLWRHWYRD